MVSLLARVWVTLVVAGLTTASILTPPVLPLAVRSPYLSTWLANSRQEPWLNWPRFWTGASQGFAIMAYVPEDKIVYPLLGRPQDPVREQDGSVDPGWDHNVRFPAYHGVSFDASTTNLSYTIYGTRPEAQVKVLLSFMSPITPNSLLRQSMPASYLTMHVEGNLDVNVYVDINGEWISGNRDNEIMWKLASTDTTKTTGTRLKSWAISRQHQQLYTEFADHAEWGTLYFTGPADAEHQCGDSGTLRRSFASSGSLTGTIDPSFRKMFDREPVFAFAKHFNLGGQADSNRTAEDSAVFTYAFVQDLVTQFASARGLTHMRPLWASYFSSVAEMLQYHYDDFEAAAQLATNYSAQLAEDAFASGSSNYVDVVALSARQVLGATQWSGTPDEPILFLKEISSNGNFQTVDVIYPAFPFFTYTNPEWLAHLLEPLLEHQYSGQWPLNYSIHDLGDHFPNATGHHDGVAEAMPVEECGNMLIMSLALANALKSNPQPPFTREAPDSAWRLPSRPRSRALDEFGMDRQSLPRSGGERARVWVTRSYSLFKEWTDYLVQDALIPSTQLCTDDFAGPLANLTNLALKGIIGLRAMSDLAHLAGEAEDAAQYKGIAQDYIQRWEEMALSTDGTHVKLSYDWPYSWTTLYNLYSGSMLCFHLAENATSLGVESYGQRQPGQAAALSGFIPRHIYRSQSDWYSSVMQKYGLPLDQRSLQSKSDWALWAAAVASTRVRSEMLDRVAKWINETSTDVPFTDLYDTEGTGHFPSPILHFMARPVVGGHFATLALERACGGRALADLDFLDAAPPVMTNVQAALPADGMDSHESGEL